jgi:hypothetical protein
LGASSVAGVRFSQGSYPVYSCYKKTRKGDGDDRALARPAIPIPRFRCWMFHQPGDRGKSDRKRHRAGQEPGRTSNELPTAEPASYPARWPVLLVLPRSAAAGNVATATDETSLDEPAVAGVAPDGCRWFVGSLPRASVADFSFLLLGWIAGLSGRRPNLWGCVWLANVAGLLIRHSGRRAGLHENAGAFSFSCLCCGRWRVER